MTGAPDITVSLVNTGNRDLLLDCLASLPAAAAETSLETMVIDNASTDGSAAAVREAYPDVEVVERERRHGFGANHNEAIRRAQGRGAGQDRGAADPVDGGDVVDVRLDPAAALQREGGQRDPAGCGEAERRGLR